MRALRIPPVYPITASNNRHDWTHIQQAEVFLSAGCRFFQVRDKTLQDGKLYHQLVVIRRLCQRYDAQLIVNDRVDLVQAAAAHGVHLGWDDLPVTSARGILGERLIGLSTHNVDQFQQAQGFDIDYVAIGPVFSTRSKISDYPPLGVQTVEDLASRSRLPVVAIGGVTLEQAPALWRAGCASVAVISDILDCENPSARIRAYLQEASHSEFCTAKNRNSSQ